MSETIPNPSPEINDYDQAREYIDQMLGRDDIQQAFIDAGLSIPTDETRISQLQYTDLDPTKDLDVKGKLNNLPLHFNPKPMLFDVYVSRPVVKRLQIIDPLLYKFLVECEEQYQNAYNHRTDSTVHREGDSIAQGALALAEEELAPLTRKEIPRYNQAQVKAQRLMAFLVDKHDSETDRDIYLPDSTPNEEYLTG